MSDTDSDISIDDLAERNPQVDRDQFDEAQEALASLRRAGLTGPTYRIDSPYERRPVESDATLADEDPSASEFPLSP